MTAVDLTARAEELAQELSWRCIDPDVLEVAAVLRALVAQVKQPALTADEVRSVVRESVLEFTRPSDEDESAQWRRIDAIAARVADRLAERTLPALSAEEREILQWVREEAVLYLGQSAGITKGDLARRAISWVDRLLAAPAGNVVPQPAPGAVDPAVCKRLAGELRDEASRIAREQFPAWMSGDMGRLKDRTEIISLQLEAAAEMTERMERATSKLLETECSLSQSTTTAMLVAQRERDAARAEVRLMRPVVAAAESYVDEYGPLNASDRQRDRLCLAVDAMRAQRGDQ